MTQQKHEPITMTIIEYCEYMREKNLVPVKTSKASLGEKIWWELPKNGKKNGLMEAHIMVRPFDFHTDVDS